MPRTPRPPVTVAGRDFPTNRGGLCKKGWTSAELLRAPDRLDAPLVRGADGALHEASWDDALDLVADVAARHPRDARRRRGRRLRRRRPHEREGVPARQVRPARARHEPHRLQRPVLHVVGGGRRQPRVRRRPRAAVPARATSTRHPPSSCSARTSPRRCRRSSGTSPAPRPPAGSSSSTRGARRPPGSPTTGAASTCSPRPGTDLALLLGLIHVVIAERLVDARLPRRAHRRVRRACAAASRRGGPSACSR